MSIRICLRVVFNYPRLSASKGVPENNKSNGLYLLDTSTEHELRSRRSFRRIWALPRVLRAVRSVYLVVCFVIPNLRLLGRTLCTELDCKFSLGRLSMHPGGGCTRTGHNLRTGATAISSSAWRHTRRRTLGVRQHTKAQRPMPDLCSSHFGTCATATTSTAMLDFQGSETTSTCPAERSQDQFCRQSCRLCNTNGGGHLAFVKHILPE